MLTATTHGQHGSAVRPEGRFGTSRPISTATSRVPPSQHNPKSNTSSGGQLVAASLGYDLAIAEASGLETEIIECLRRDTKTTTEVGGTMGV